MVDFDKIINEVSSNIESFHFNKSVAKIYEYVNKVNTLMTKKTIHEEELLLVVKRLAIIIHPFIPHISEEIWENLGCEGLCIMAKWPDIKTVSKEKEIKMPIQVNGKVRSLININTGEEKEVVLNKVMSDIKVKKIIENKELVKTIFVKDKIVNLVIR